MEVKDLDFISDFSLKMKKNGYINGILMWFDNTFDHGKTPIVLDTSPYKKSTHWKQGLF